MKKTNLFEMMLCSLFAALTIVFSQISIPIGPVPINLATLAFFLAGGVLGSVWGAASQALFALLGLAGMPVFAGFRGGPGVLAGPTGGYIISYIAGAFLIGILCEHFGREAWKLLVFNILGLALCYAMGTAWFVVVTGKNLAGALALCVFPFLPGDAVKIAAAAALVPRLARICSKMRERTTV